MLNRRIWGRGDVDIVGARQIIIVLRTQEPKTIGEDFQDAFAIEVAFLLGVGLEDGKDEILFAKA
jgi:hypothetical protein